MTKSQNTVQEWFAKHWRWYGSVAHRRRVSEWVSVCCETIRHLQLLVSDHIPSL